jgi:hypothetical protein
MSHLLFTGFRIAYRLACFVWCLFFVVGCITAAQLGQKSASNAKIPNAQVEIKSIDMKVNLDEININIIGNSKIKYSAVKQDFPLGVMVYLHDAIMSDKFKQPSVLKETQITSLSASYVDNTKNTIAVKILLSENLNYQVQEKDNTLTVMFYKKGGGQNLTTTLPFPLLIYNPLEKLIFFKSLVNLKLSNHLNQPRLTLIIHLF